MASLPIVPPVPVAVLGAGNMGSGIAQACAQAGFPVRVRDISEELIRRGRERVEQTLEGAIQRGKLTAEGRRGVLERIEWTTSLADAVRGSGLVIEAVFEEEKVKRPLFSELAPLVDAGTLVATNTSSLSVARLAEGFPNPERFVGLHFFYPAAINRLLEVIDGPATHRSTSEALEVFGYRLKKVPIRVKDSPGFCVNRFFVPYLNESIRIVDEGVANLHTVEAVGAELFGTSLGPFELMNVTGIPIAYHSMQSLQAAFGPAYAPAAGLESKFQDKTPWDWKSSVIQPEAKSAVRRRLLGLVFGIATRLVEEGVATPEDTDRGATVGLRWKQGPFALLSAEGIPTALAQVEEYAHRWKGSFPVSDELRRSAHKGTLRWPMRVVRVVREGPVAWVLLDRPEVLNSINSEVLAQLDQAFARLSEAADLRAVVLAGSSPVFAAGADIAEMAQKDLAAGREFGFLGQAVCHRIANFRTPVLALVEGYALGGGLELALACDFIVASEGAQLGLPEVTVGIHPGFGGASRLARLIGADRAKFLVYSGLPVSAEEAVRLGFVVKTVPRESARAEVRAMALLIAERAPLAVAWVKGVINRGLDAPLESALRLEGESAGHTFGTHDRTEGMQAFLERRKPKFTGT